MGCAGVRVIAVIGLSLLLAAAPGCGKKEGAASGAAGAGGAAVRANAADMPNTVVTAVLDCPIEQGKNVLWCCTFQLAWNQYRAEFGADLPGAVPPLVNALNSSKVTDADIDEASYVAVAGQTGDDFDERIRTAISEAFGGVAGQRLIAYLSEQPPGLPVAYAALGKQLAFEYAFTRSESPFTFNGRDVESFGIEQYLGVQKDEVRMARQVVIYDYDRAHPNHFIVELKTTSEGDRLILARVPAEGTLAETVAAVRRQVAEAEPQELLEDGDLAVPVIDFDVLRDYAELLDLGFLMARQRTRFRLDETGAVLESEALMAGGTFGQHLIFDGPFLVLLERKGATNPYFALWVANAELLTPWHGD